jgi:Tol biopolymer transport system component
VTLPVGTRLGHFIVRTPLGKGGMGEVYRATDTALDRDVAIKVLPSEVADDADRLSRFEREARVLAALNHPNIAHVYGFERAQVEHSRVNFLAMELVPGEDLAERLTRGPVAIEETIEIAKQVAAALEQAHEAGIVHRDLKPANIKLTPDGAVKVLDFGLAKAHARDGGGAVPADLSASPTFATSQTQAGIILGTAAYMAPEQVRGKRVDSRADIWAFGVVLFEMLSGRRAFAGDTVTDILAAVLRADLDLTALPAGTPHRLRELLRRCLERDPHRRLRHIGEARILLDDVSAEPHDALAPAAVPMPASRTGRAWPWALAVVVAAFVGVGVGRFAMAPTLLLSRPVRFEISAGAVSSAVLSPDGTQLAIASQDQLWVRDMARLETRALQKTDGAVRPFWSPDSRTIAYGARGKLWKVAADGGIPTVICDLVSGLWDEDAGGAWLANGTIVYSDGNTALFQVSAQGGDPMPIVKPDPQRELHFHTVSALPDGRSVVYVVHRAGEGVGSNTLAIWSAGQARVLLEMKNQSLDDPVYSPSGHLLFRRGPTNVGVWAVPFSMNTLQTTGEPFLVSQGTRRPSVAADGTLVLLPPQRQRPINLVWVDREGNVVGRIDEPRFRQTTASISPDGDRIAVPEAGDGEVDIWQYDIRRNTRSRVTVNVVAIEPRWLPDSRSVLYTARPAPGQGPVIRRVMADGSGRDQQIVQGMRGVVSADGATLFYTQPENEGQRLWYRSVAERNAKPALFVDKAFYSITASPSPDGRLIAYEAEPGPGQYQVYLRRFPPSEGTWQVSTDGGSSPRWSRDGRLFFAHGPEIMEVHVTADPEVLIGTPTTLFKRAPTGGATVPAPFDVSPDGTRFLIYEPVGDASDERITVVQHWFTEFAK